MPKLEICNIMYMCKAHFVRDAVFIGWEASINLCDQPRSYHMHHGHIYKYFVLVK